MMGRLAPWLACVVVMVAGLARLRFDTDILGLLPADLPEAMALRLQQRHFPAGRDLLITVTGTNAATVEAAARRVAGAIVANTGLAASARWRPPEMDPASAGENVAWLWMQAPPEAFLRLTEGLGAARVGTTLAEARDVLATSLDPLELARVGNDPLGLTRVPGADGMLAGAMGGGGIFGSADGLMRVVQVAPPEAGMSHQRAAAWIEAVRKVSESAISGTEEGEGSRLGFTGGPAFLAEIGTGMEGDLRSSVGATVLLIGLLFWWAHRSWRPVGLLLLALMVTLALTLGLGGMVMGRLNVVSVGFAAVLMGLTVDYGLVAYQEWVASPGRTVEEVRREVAPGVGWSAATTAGTFLLLGLAGLPGLAQLGTLTAIGLGVGALVMLHGFLPMAMRWCRPGNGANAGKGWPMARTWRPAAGVAAGLVVVMAWRGMPVLQDGNDPLRPRNSAAYATMDAMKRKFGKDKEPSWLVFRASGLDELGRSMEAAEAALRAAHSRGDVNSYQLPTAFWPRPGHEAINRGLARELAAEGDRLMAAARAAGFTEDSLALARAVMARWRSWEPVSGSPWPTNHLAQWIASQASARTDSGEWLAAGLVTPTSPDAGERVARMLPKEALLGDWERLAPTLTRRVSDRVTWLTGLVVVVLAGCLWLAFGRWREVVVGFAGLALGMGLLLAVMSLAGLGWNLLSLVALPLLLGSSVDSTIHVQWGLRRHGADGRALWRTTGRALLLCAGANIAGFGSLAWSSNAGLASMDIVCALGVGCVFVSCVGLLPGLWLSWPRGKAAQGRSDGVDEASSVYRGGAWRIGVWLACKLPTGLARGTARMLAGLYVALRPGRLAVVVENLAPWLAPRTDVRAVARRNFMAFSEKVVDLLRQEGGRLRAEDVRPGDGWEHFHAATGSGKGVLLVTPHLGNWEAGSLLLGRMGVRPLVLTAAEPTEGLTEARRAARARMGADTLVVGEDPFAFVEVIRRLQSGGVVALLVDRPMGGRRTWVEWHGRRFAASGAAAELARATGCMVLPVTVLREGSGYRADALEPVLYDRATLGSHEARAAMTGAILRAFETAVRQHPEQWFHFVPVWREDDAREGRS